MELYAIFTIRPLGRCITFISGLIALYKSMYLLLRIKTTLC